MMLRNFELFSKDKYFGLLTNYPFVSTTIAKLGLLWEPHFAKSRKMAAARHTSTFYFPRSARFHVPDFHNAGSIVDVKKLAESPFKAELKYQFVLVEDRGRWTLITHRSAVPREPFPTVHISAENDRMALTLSDVRPQAVQKATFASMDEAIAAKGGTITMLTVLLILAAIVAVGAIIWGVKKS